MLSLSRQTWAKLKLKLSSLKK